jgi:hypothetical protein
MILRSDGAQAHEPRQMRDDFGETHDRELVDVVPGDAAGGPHFGPPHRRTRLGEIAGAARR